MSLLAAAGFAAPSRRGDLKLWFLAKAWQTEFCWRSARFPDRETARSAFQINWWPNNFAACANILPGVESVYRWEEKIETGNEALVFFKLSEDRQSAFQENLRSLHPYEVPEIIFIPISTTVCPNTCAGLPKIAR